MLKIFKALPKPEPETFEIEVSGEVRGIGFSESDSVLSALQKARVKIPSSCGGMGTCGTCRIEAVDSLHLIDEPNEIEIEMARERLFKEHERLACQVCPRAGLKIRLP